MTPRWRDLSLRTRVVLALFAVSLITLWLRAAPWAVSRTVRVPEALVSAFFASDGRRVITLPASEGIVRVLDAATGAELQAIAPKEVEAKLSSADAARAKKYVNTIVFSPAEAPDGRRYLVRNELPLGADANRAKEFQSSASIIEVGTKKILATLSGHTDSIHYAGFSPDGKHVITTSLDGTARIYDSANGTALTVLPLSDRPPHSAVYAPDALKIVTASSDGAVSFWYRRRPEALSGLAWLPEFWLTLAIAIVSIWSFIHDWRSRPAHTGVKN